MNAFDRALFLDMTRYEDLAGASGSMPERTQDPPDTETGWERPRPAERCACGRPVVAFGKCTWCCHSINKDDL